MNYLRTIFVILFFLVSLANGKYDRSQYKYCEQYENKEYQLTVTFPNKKPFYAGLRLLSNGVFDELFSIANGKNAAEVGANFALSNRVGYYKCLSRYQMRLTVYGYLYKIEDVSFLKDNGAVVMQDYFLKFQDNVKSCVGKVKFAVFKNGTNPFTTKDDPVFEGDPGDVKW